MKILITGSSGYIGSYLASCLIENGHEVVGVDIASPVLEDKIGFTHYLSKFETLTSSFISKFDVVIHLAAISNVRDADQFPNRAIELNGIETFRFVQLCNDVSTKIIYASSGSIFSSNNGSDYSLKGMAVNAYDGSKMAADLMVESVGLDALAMCFGTLAGNSPSIRKELVFNAMSISSFENGKVEVWNGDNLRSILFLRDLLKYINIILENLDKVSGFSRVQMYSWSGSINDLGYKISQYWNAEFKTILGEGTYSFVLSDHEFTKTFGKQINKTSLLYETNKMKEYLHGK